MMECATAIHMDCVPAIHMDCAAAIHMDCATAILMDCVPAIRTLTTRDGNLNDLVFANVHTCALRMHWARSLSE